MSGAAMSKKSRGAWLGTAAPKTAAPIIPATKGRVRNRCSLALRCYAGMRISLRSVGYVPPADSNLGSDLR